MKTVYKFTFINERQQFDVPKGAEVLSADVQDGRIVIWFLVDPNAETEKRTFVIMGTGRMFDDKSECLKHVGSVQVDRFVWHVFEVLERKKPVVEVYFDSKDAVNALQEARRSFKSL